MRSEALGTIKKGAENQENSNPSQREAQVRAMEGEANRQWRNHFYPSLVAIMVLTVLRSGTSLTTNDAEHLFMGLFAIYLSTFVKCFLMLLPLDSL